MKYTVVTLIRDDIFTKHNLDRYWSEKKSVTEKISLLGLKQYSVLSMVRPASSSVTN